MATAIPPKAPTTILSRLFRRSRNGSGEELVGPIRGEVLGLERLGERARAVARGHHLLPAQKQRGSGPLLLRLDNTKEVLDRVYQELNAGAERGLETLAVLREGERVRESTALAEHRERDAQDQRSR